MGLSGPRFRLSAHLEVCGRLGPFQFSHEIGTHLGISNRQLLVFCQVRLIVNGCRLADCEIGSAGLETECRYCTGHSPKPCAWSMTDPGPVARVIILGFAIRLHELFPGYKPLIQPSSHYYSSAISLLFIDRSTLRQPLSPLKSEYSGRLVRALLSLGPLFQERPYLDSSSPVPSP